MHLPLSIMPARWNIIVIDLYQITEHFGAKAEEARMAFRLISVEIRASSKVKGIFQSDYLYSVDRLPKDISFPLKKDEDFFEKYHYTVDNCR